MKKTRAGLCYIGQGATLSIPARDLTPDEVQAHGGERAILAITDPCTGRPMYEKARAEKPEEVDSDA